MDFFLKLFDTTGFPPRWYCGIWTSTHGWLHILSDLAIWAAYFAIPGVLYSFLRQRKDMPFRRVFVLFIAFILFCGVTHLLDAVVFWWPAYRLMGVSKFATAIVSWATLLALFQVAPRSLSMRTPEELEREVQARRLAEQRLQAANDAIQEELREVAARLSEADRRKDEFLATLAHELRNPLAPIRSGLEVLKMAKNDPEAIEEIRETMERQTQQLIKLVDDLMDVSRITRGKLELRKDRVQFADVVQSAVEASQPSVNEGNHVLSVSLPREPVYLNADPHRLAQILSNLLNNAGKYTPAGGRIWLTAKTDGDGIAISVRDSGVGIAPEMQERIFEMFAQIQQPMDRSDTGLGIGLTLVKSLVEMHGGTIRVQSDGFNTGSEFTVSLPVDRTEPADGAAAPGQKTDTAPAVKRKVLVVDDNQAAADMLGLVIKILGNEVRTASNGLEAIQLCETFQPDMVLMDLGMPTMNGYEAARHIRQQPWGAQIMLVALTGWGQEEDKQRTREAGFDHHLVKPAEPAEIQKLLDGLNRPNARDAARPTE